MAGQAGWYRAPGEDGMLRYWNGTSWTAHRQPVPATPQPVAAAIPLLDAVPNADPMAEYERQFESTMDTRAMIDQLSFVLDQRQFDASSASPAPHNDAGTPFAASSLGQLAPTVLATGPTALTPSATPPALTPAPAPAVIAADLPEVTTPVAPDAQRKRLLVAVRGMWIGVAIVVIGLVVMGLVSANIFTGAGEAKASGIVTSLGSTANNACAPIARFAVTGKSYTAGAAAVSPCPVGLGQTVDIFYSAADPAADAHIAIGTGLTQYLGVIPLLGVFLLASSIGLFTVRAGSIAGGIAVIRDGKKRSKKPVA
jgi:Protein of unknown function (DUF2510)